MTDANVATGVARSVLRQVEYYFSPENWDADEWLRGQADDDPSGQGLLPLKLIG